MHEAEDDGYEMIDEKAVQECSNFQFESTSFLLAAADAPMAANTTSNDVEHGVAHGYWKDLANILLLAVNDQLKVDGDVEGNLNVDLRKTVKAYKREWDVKKAKEAHEKRQASRHLRFQQKFNGEGETQVEGENSSNSRSNKNFKALHLIVARLFASQLRADAAALSSTSKMRSISLAAKWCPSPAESHDKQTFLVSSIAEAIFPAKEVCPSGTTDRVTYLKHARLALRSKLLSPLRKYLGIVERDITAGNFRDIKYDRIPSMAMDRYSGLLLNRDEGSFANYLERVVAGRARISGAALLPSTLVSKARRAFGRSDRDNGKNATDQVQRLAEQQLLDGQWKTLVRRIKDSGKIESTIAVCDVSASMLSPRFPDDSCPMDSAVGLSLLLAEVVDPPFGGNFITFSEPPSIRKVGGARDDRTFKDKVAYIFQSNWDMNTDFVAVFENLTLPMAVSNKLRPEEMVKLIFVFSDMQFDAAQKRNERWTTSFKAYQEALCRGGLRDA
ncbi:uncharacterized protein PV09_09281 [Verruconis gallopava]|uniref:Uncharacterized protein n=1 Tax=Verruconis gallopava TaxID=253628 RepID=A0A0D1YE90_9PEZI|nr:uncharacterized protein PV09_09281 [Verruconis gallopava]KIV99001.1 hypothetical protein PV09_09281 [Verruconis gallopava]